MRIPILFLVATLCFSSLSAQQTKHAAKQWGAKEDEIPSVPDKKDSVSQPIIFTYVEQMPIPTFDMQQYLKANLVYPAGAPKEYIGGRVIVRFSVDAEGAVADPRIMRGLSPELDSEALRIVSRMPKWKPAKQNGKPVKVLYNLPIEFKP
jgi:TonB family protein